MCIQHLSYCFYALENSQTISWLGSTARKKNMTLGRYWKLVMLTKCQFVTFSLRVLYELRGENKLFSLFQMCCICHLWIKPGTFSFLFIHHLHGNVVLMVLSMCWQESCSSILPLISPSLDITVESSGNKMRAKTDGAAKEAMSNTLRHDILSSINV